MNESMDTNCAHSFISSSNRLVDPCRKLSERERLGQEMYELLSAQVAHQRERAASRRWAVEVERARKEYCFVELVREPFGARAEEEEEGAGCLEELERAIAAKNEGNEAEQRGPERDTRETSSRSCRNLQAFFTPSRRIYPET